MDSGEPRGEEALFFKPFKASMTILRYHSDPQTRVFRKQEFNLLWDNKVGMVCGKWSLKSSIGSIYMPGLDLK
jgi:hypothetical protein